MLLNTLEHLAYRVAGLTAVVYAGEKTNILQAIMRGDQSTATLALKMSAVLSGSEYLSDQLLSVVTNTQVPGLTTTLSQMGVAFVANALVLFVMERFKFDDVIVSSMNDEMRAVQYAVLFVIVQEISYKLLTYYLKRY